MYKSNRIDTLPGAHQIIKGALLIILNNVIIFTFETFVN